MLPEGPARVVQGGSNAAVRVDTETGSWRLKSSGISWASAMEVTMAKVFRLTGLAAPDTALADEEIATFPPGAWQVASRYEDAFQDLGAFLASDDAATLAARGDEGRRIAYAEQRARHGTAVVACEEILQRAGVEHFWQLGRPDLVAEHAARDRARFEALEAMNRMLPVDVRADQLRHFVASRWLANWDHLNYRMENFGYTVRDGQPVGMTVDFGSCGPLGFRSLRSPNAMLPKSASRDIAILQRPRSLFAIPEKYVENGDAFDAMHGDPGLLHDTLQWPYGFQSESIAEMMRPPAVVDPAIAAALAEMGYRLALLPEASIASVVDRYWRCPDGVTAAEWPDAGMLTRQLCARRDTMLRRYDPAQIAAWIEEDPARAVAVREQMIEGFQAALGPDGHAEEHARAVQSRHDSLARATLPGRAAAINGLRREIRCLQSFHNCTRRLQQALQAGDAAAERNAIEDLMSPAVYGQLLLSLELGTRTQPHGMEAFRANQAWLTLLSRLVQEGKVSAAEAATLLLTPTAEGVYPPNVGHHSHRHPELGMAFIRLLDTLIEVPAGVEAPALRGALLAAKESGSPNYYSALLASDASNAWKERLKASALWPSNEEIQQLKSTRALLRWKLRKALPRDAGTIVEPAHLAEQQRMALQPLAGQVAEAYAPAKLVQLELPLLREDVFSRMRLVTGDEMRSISATAEQAVERAWKEAVSKHPGLSGMAVPPDLIREQQREACAGYEESVRTQRREDAETLIVEGERRYQEAVLAQADMSLDARRALLAGCADGIIAGIDAMVRSVARTGTHSLEETVGTRVQDRARAEAHERATAQVAAEARIAAQRQAARSAEQAASQMATRAAADRAQHGAALEVQRVAALRAHREAGATARERARERAEQEARERTARVSEARTARIAERLQALRNDRRGEEMDREIERRLAALRAPAAAASSRAPAARAAEYLDGSGRPGVAHR